MFTILGSLAGTDGSDSRRPPCKDTEANSAVEGCLKQGFEWLMFVDDDVCIPADTVPRLMSHGKDIISGVYYRRAPPIQPVILKYKPDGIFLSNGPGDPEPCDYAIEAIKTLRLIEQFPQAWHPLTSEIRRCRLRRFPYSVVYAQDGEDLLVMAENEILAVIEG